MHGKEFVIKIFSTYFTLVTLITVGTLILGLCLEPDARFGYMAFASPLIYAACGLLPVVVMYSRRELTAVEYFIRKAVQYVLVEILVLGAAYQGTDAFTEQKGTVISMGICVSVIFVLTHVVGWLQECVSARRMTEELIRFQKNVK